MKTSFDSRACKFIHDIYPFIKNCHDVESFQKQVRIYNSVTHRKVKVAYGMARICLICSDYCIKIDYSSYGCETYGGCENEYQFYRFAQKEGYDYLFAKVVKVEIFNKEWYIMERINNIGLEEYECNYAEELVSYEESDWLKTYCHDLHNENFGFKNGRCIIIDYAMNHI